MSNTTAYELHLIASAPSHGDRHVDPDSTARKLSGHASKADAHAAGRAYMREHPNAWLQVQDFDYLEIAEDVSL